MCRLYGTTLIIRLINNNVCARICICQLDSVRSLSGPETLITSNSPSPKSSLKNDSQAFDSFAWNNALGTSYPGAPSRQPQQTGRPNFRYCTKSLGDDGSGVRHFRVGLSLDGFPRRYPPLGMALAKPAAQVDSSGRGQWPSRVAMPR